MKRKVHVVPHSHWDREWYFTTSRSKVYLMKDLKDVLDTLESNPDFKYFMVDAQGSLLDDYIKWMPQDKDRITKLVKEKKLVIGPWYTQTDQLFQVKALFVICITEWSVAKLLADIWMLDMFLIHLDSQVTCLRFTRNLVLMILYSGEA